MTLSAVVPTNLDVFCGRGRQCFEHEGNKSFRELIARNLDNYVNSSSRKAKTTLVRSIAETIVKQGGRFLIQRTINGNTEWIDGGEKRGREKVGHTFRDALTEKAKCIVGLQRKMQPPRVPSQSRSTNQQSNEANDPFGWERDVFHKQQLLPAYVPSTTPEDVAIEDPSRLDGSGMKRKRASSNADGICQRVKSCPFRDLQKEKDSSNLPIRSSCTGTNTDLHQELKPFQQRTAPMWLVDFKVEPFHHNNSTSTIHPTPLQGDASDRHWSLTFDEVQVRSLFMQTMMVSGRELLARVVSSDGSQVLCDACSARMKFRCSSGTASFGSAEWASERRSLSDNDEDLSVGDWSELDIAECDAATTVSIGEDDVLDCANFDWLVGL